MVRMEIGDRRESGFTLLEVVIAMAIIATGFIAVYSLHIQTLAVSNSVRFYTKAPLLAQKKMSELESNLSQLSDSSGDFGDDYTGYAYKVTVSDIENEILGESAVKMKKIELQIGLNEGENSYDVTAYRFAGSDER
ncbi:MAG: prepilin-type N-terminal cleavage/methylation domain-containing protein [Proteobacteria bacterium]|nr:prepilin-type N-terminal cleavage/methylation domain-containing protein [Pseudomonadota bacterium]